MGIWSESETGQMFGLEFVKCKMLKEKHRDQINCGLKIFIFEILTHMLCMGHTTCAWGPPDPNGPSYTHQTQMAPLIPTKPKWPLIHPPNPNGPSYPHTHMAQKIYASIR